MQKTDLLVVNSADRVSGNSSNFVVKFNPAVQAPKKIKLYNVSMPNTVYNITSLNNLIYFKESAGLLTGTITQGSYNSTTIITAIQTAMNAVGTNTYTAVLNTTTFLLTVTGTGNFQFLFASNTANSVGSLIGYNTDTALATSQTADSVIQLNKPMVFYICISELPVCVRSTNYLDNGTFVFTSTVNSGNLESFNVLSRYHEITPHDNQNIYQFSIQLRGPGNIPYSLNGADWSMTLKLIY